MGISRIDINETFTMEVYLFDEDGVLVTGETVNYVIRESSDNSLFDSGTLTEVGTTGLYTKDVSFAEEVQYRIIYTVSGYPIGQESLVVGNVNAIIVGIGDDLDLIKEQTAPGGKWL